MSRGPDGPVVSQLVYRDPAWNLRLGLLASVFVCATVLLVASVGFVVLPDSTVAVVIYVTAVAAAIGVAALVTVRCYSHCALTREGDTLIVQGPFKLERVKAADVINIEPRQVFVDRYCVRLQLRRERPPNRVSIVALPYDQRHVLDEISGRGTA